MSNLFLISDAAKQVQVEAHVLRYWEEELGLPIKRNELGHRYYTEEDVDRFREIKGLKERGLQLKAIRMVLRDGKLDVLSPRQTSAGEKAKKDIPHKEEAAADKMTRQEEKLQTEKVQEEKMQTEKVQTEKMQAEKMQEEREQTEKKLAEGKPDSNAGESGSNRGKRETAEKDRRVAGPVKEEYEEDNILFPAAGSELLEGTETKAEKAQRLQWLLQQLFRETLQENNKELCRDMKESILKEMDYQFRVQEEREDERSTERLKQEEEHYKKIDELLRKKRRFLKK